MDLFFFPLKNNQLDRFKVVWKQDGMCFLLILSCLASPVRVISVGFSYGISGVRGEQVIAKGEGDPSEAVLSSPSLQEA